MADALLDPGHDDHELDLTFDDDGGNGDDIDLDLGAETTIQDGQSSISLSKENYRAGEPAGHTDANIENGDYTDGNAAPRVVNSNDRDIDEIDYDESKGAQDDDAIISGGKTIHEQVPSETAEGEENGPEQQPGDLDEIDYEEVLDEAVSQEREHTDMAGTEHLATGQGVSNVDIPGGRPGVGQQLLSDFDFDFNDTAGNPDLDGYQLTDFDVLPDSIGLGGPDMGSAAAITDALNAADADGDVDGNIPDTTSHPTNDPSPTGLGKYETNPPNVIVLWGDEVCPLFQTSDDEDPSQFYLEDVKAINDPLSEFLASIRKSIASYVRKEDEIHIRVRELGLEFGETTTRALLEHFTFHNLLALHDLLATNEGREAPRSLHLELTTKPHCSLRLQELISGAQSGKGLSTFQPSTRDDVSAESDDHENMSRDISPDEEGVDEVAEDESPPSEDAEPDDDEEEDVASSAEPAEPDEDTTPGDSGPIGQQSSGAQSQDEDMAADENDDLIDYEGSDEAEEQDITTEDAAFDDDLDLNIYANDNETDGLGDLVSPHAANDLGNGDVDAADASLAEDDLFSFENDELDGQGVATADEVERTDPHQAEPVNFVDGIESAFQEPGQEATDPSTLSSTLHQGQDVNNDLDVRGSYDEAQEDLLDEEYLDFEHDVVHGNDAEERLTSDKVTPGNRQNSEGPHGTSPTATVDGDEIDYEDVPPPDGGADSTLQPTSDLLGGNGEKAEIDEIDWDDEDKIIAPVGSTSTPTSTAGKRSREVDEADELLDGGHDPKRHRP